MNGGAINMKIALTAASNLRASQPAPEDAGSRCNSPRALSAQELDAVAAAGGKAGIISGNRL